VQMITKSGGTLKEHPV